MSKQIKDSQNNNQSPKFQGRHVFHQQIKREIVYIPHLFPYLMSAFIWILHYPAIHLLALPTLIMVVVIFARELFAYTLRIWTHGPSEPLVTFHWWRVWEDLLTFIGPLAFLALLMFLNHYPW
jgi:hypothetical protein